MPCLANASRESKLPPPCGTSHSLRGTGGTGGTERASEDLRGYWSGAEGVLVLSGSPAGTTQMISPSLCGTTGTGGTT